VALSLVVRSAPVMTAATGTLVARPVRMTWYNVVPLGATLTGGRGSSSSTTASLASRRRWRGSFPPRQVAVASGAAAL
jgi:hypothetical protein